MMKLSQKRAGHMLGFAGVGLFAFQMHNASQSGRMFSLSLYSLWRGFFDLMDGFVVMLQDFLPYSMSETILATLYYQKPPYWAVRVLEMVSISGFLLALGFFLVVLRENEGRRA